VKRIETDVARPIVGWLESMQWDVYQEVLCGGPRADIVALQGRLIWVVEVKTTLTLDVIEQAHNWLDHAHYVSIAVPDARSHRTMAQRVCRYFGIGMFEVGDILRSGNNVQQRVPPKLGRARVHPTLSDRLRSNCRPECKTWGEAGNATSDYYSPFKGTCRAVVEFLEKNGPSSVKTVMSGIEHHYRTESSARASMVVWIAQGKVPGVEIDARTRPALLRLSKKSEAAA
jgi:hypothetical protein